MDLVLCHTTADFDTLGAAVGITCLKPGTRIVLTGGCHPTVQKFLTLRRNHYRIIDRKAVTIGQIRSITVVDTHHRSRIGPAAPWIDFAIANHLPITIYDHHLESDEASTALEPPIPATDQQIESVGATTTLVVEALQAQSINIDTWEATVMALGIHVDTGSLTYARATPRDAAALTWLMTQGISQQAVLEATKPGLSPPLQTLLSAALEKLQTKEIEGYQLGWVYLTTEGFIPGLSSLASHLVTLIGLDGLLLGSEYKTGKGEGKLTLIGRGRPQKSSPPIGDGINFQRLLTPLGGGGHPHAASAVVKKADLADLQDHLQKKHFQPLFQELVTQLTLQIPHSPTALDLMSSPVRTIRPETTIGEAQRILLRYGHSGLCVADTGGQLIGIISRRDIDLALHHGFSHAPVKGYMTTNLNTIRPDTPLNTIQNLMVTYDIGRLPVLQGTQLQGIVTRTDVLRQVYHDQVSQAQADTGVDMVQVDLTPGLATSPTQPETSHQSEQLNAAVDTFSPQSISPKPPQLYQQLQQCLRNPALSATGNAEHLWHLLSTMAEEATRRGWHLYVVGGAVRDLLLPPPGQSTRIKDIDLVVDGFHSAADVGAGVALAQAIQQRYPEAELQIHGQFQTAALIWHGDPTVSTSKSAQADMLDRAGTRPAPTPILIDIATARTEFYPYPAANPEVEASSIRQDLYRRDFTINAMAIRLTPPQPGLLIDFFGGWIDLQTRHVRVLHANSFIEDPTRIFRAVRFAVRLDFSIHPQTETFIRYAVESGIYTDLQNQIKHKQKAKRVPALQTRLRAELKYILETDYWKPALGLLDRLGALTCLHSSLKMTPELWQRLYRVDRWVRRFALAERLETWLMLLEVMLAQLDEAVRSQVAESIHLPTHSIERLSTLAATEAKLFETLMPDDPHHPPRPSQIYQVLTPLSFPTLLLISSRHPRTLGPKIWHYLTRLAELKPLLNGHDLKQLGYRPGPQFKNILEALTYATVDGDIKTRLAAKAYVAKHFPLAEP